MAVGFSLTIIVVIWLIAMAVVAAIVVFCIILRKKRCAEAEREQETDTTPKVPPMQPLFSESKGKTANQSDLAGETPTVSAEEQVTAGGMNTENGNAAFNMQSRMVEITLVEMGPTATRTLKGKCANRLTIGRKEGADIVIDDDDQLSGMHCELCMEDGRMYLTDLNSQNGTFLNGIPVHTKVPVEQEDCIFIGAFEYRIFWE